MPCVVLPTDPEAQRPNVVVRYGPGLEPLPRLVGGKRNLPSIAEAGSPNSVRTTHELGPFSVSCEKRKGTSAAKKTGSLATSTVVAGRFPHATNIVKKIPVVAKIGRSVE